MEQVDLDDFTVVDETITTAELDAEVAKLRDLKDTYEAKKRESDNAHGDYQTQRLYLVSLLSKAGKKKYEAEGIGLISLSSKLKVKYPKTLEDRLRFLAYIDKKYGSEGMADLVSVNYQTLQSFYNGEFEEAASQGSADSFEVPGISEPESEISLSFRKSK